MWERSLEVWLFLHGLCEQITKMEEDWDAVHRLSIKNREGLFWGMSQYRM